jgi:hypothetical protein
MSHRKWDEGPVEDCRGYSKTCVFYVTPQNTIDSRRFPPPTLMKKIENLAYLLR